MYKHLFLEGPIQSGKSTLLRKLLQPHMAFVGGFTSQRLLNNDGLTEAFRIGAAEYTPLTAPFADVAAKNLGGVFRINCGKKKPLKFPEVFDNDGVKYLTENEGKAIILLDEIGGAELLSDDFRKALYALLESDTPCIGVIKQAHKAAAMSSAAGYAEELVYYNHELRRSIIDKYDGKVLAFSRSNEKLKEEIEDFLYNIFAAK